MKLLGTNFFVRYRQVFGLSRFNTNIYLLLNLFTKKINVDCWDKLERDWKLRVNFWSWPKSGEGVGERTLKKSVESEGQAFKMTNDEKIASILKFPKTWGGRKHCFFFSQIPAVDPGNYFTNDMVWIGVYIVYVSCSVINVGTIFRWIYIYSDIVCV